MNDFLTKSKFDNTYGCTLALLQDVELNGAWLRNTTDAQNLYYRLKANKLVDLINCELVSQYIGYKPNNALSGLKHLGTFEWW